MRASPHAQAVLGRVGEDDPFCAKPRRRGDDVANSRLRLLPNLKQVLHPLKNTREHCIQSPCTPIKNPHQSLFNVPL